MAACRGCQLLETAVETPRPGMPGVMTACRVRPLLESALEMLGVMMVCRDCPLLETALETAQETPQQAIRSQAMRQARPAATLPRWGRLRAGRR